MFQDAYLKAWDVYSLTVLLLHYSFQGEHAFCTTQNGPLSQQRKLLASCTQHVYKDAAVSGFRFHHYLGHGSVLCKILLPARQGHPA